MGLFGKKKPTEFDEVQDKQLKQLMANQTWILKQLEVLIPNNNVNIQKRDKIASDVADLKKRMTANEKKDAEQAELFANLSRSASQTEEEKT